MATLILATVGRVFGGQIGAAVGAGVGQIVDGALFRPKGRQGPRLTDLSVQTSAYGTQIPKVFGTMRVAGCVIWSTDLIESRSSSRSGKGQPTVTSYSYAASFAVALSGRPILGVGRIWADGVLLRGAAGDFKTSTGFRLHPGSEAQDADPVIASAEGGMAPAHRGIAYAVFENFQLADYGNRLPSLTFEVFADAGPVASGAIAVELGGGAVRAAAGLAPLHGFTAYGDSVRGVIETLAEASGAWFAPDGWGVRMTAETTPVAMLDDTGASLSAARGERGDRTIAPIERVPQSVTIAHYDPARDYQTGLQRARRPGPGRAVDRLDMPAALSAGEAKTLAEAVLARAEAARERRRLRLALADLAIRPGDCVGISGEEGRWRVSGWNFEQHVLMLECTRIALATAAATATPGRAVAAIDRVAGPTIVHAFEIPPLDDAVLASPRLMIAAAGSSPGWRRATLLYSIDDGARWTSAGATAVAATIGAVTLPPGFAPAALIDTVSTIELELAQDAMTLSSADAAGLDGGANLALVGDELLQFAQAEQIGPARWRLSRLLRGRRGTEGAAGAQAVGARFVLIEQDALVSVELPLSALGGTIRVMASGVGDISGPAQDALLLAGRSVLPPAPVHLRREAASDGTAMLRWTRRSRAGWRWIDGVDAPLAEEREEYRVTIVPFAGAARDVVTVTPEISLLPAEIAAGWTASVRQRGAHGESLTAAASSTDS